MNTGEQLESMHYYRDGEYLVLDVPVEFRRREGRKRIVAQAAKGATGSQQAAPSSAPNKSLCLAIARGHRFLGLLENGDARSIGELAQTLNVDGAYIRRLLRLTLLAPEIIEAILEGDEPQGLSLERLRSFPLAWTEQRAVLWPSSGRRESRNDQPGD